MGALPKETIFESRRRNQRKALVFYSLLSLAYVLFFNLYIWTLEIGWQFITQAFDKNIHFSFGWSWMEFGIISGLAVGLLAFLFFKASRRSLDSMLEAVGARPPDPDDRYHRLFTRTLEETALGMNWKGLRPVVIATEGCNAFSMVDPKGNAAVGVTEGLLSRLGRDELAAVVTHELGHLAQGDSRLVTVACAMRDVFLLGWKMPFSWVFKFGPVLGMIVLLIIEVVTICLHGAFEVSDNLWLMSNSNICCLILIVLLLVTLPVLLLIELVNELFFAFFSRQREYMADAYAANVAKDPLALAEALYKLSVRYNGRMEIPDSFSGLFLLDPQVGASGDGSLFSGILSLHPPMDRRLAKLTRWANSDLAGFLKRKTQDVPQKDPDLAEDGELPRLYYAWDGKEWKGPCSAVQWAVEGKLQPLSWVCPVGTDAVSRANSHFDLLSAITGPAPAATKNCPRCKSALAPQEVEGLPLEVCPFCQGTLLKKDDLEKILIRDGGRLETPPSKVDRWKRADPGNGPVDPDHFPAILCPFCARPMHKAFYSFDIRITLKRCWDCGGVWCDSGDLKKIREMVEERTWNARRGLDPSR